MKISGYQFQSCFGPYMERFIQEKRDAGYIYASEEWKLKHFDAFCVSEGITKPFLSRDLVKKWGKMREDEELVTCSARISIIRQFCLYLTSLGMDAYIPSHFYKAAKKVVHILSDDEIMAIFKALDTYTPAIKVSGFRRLAMEYKVLFRLIYCCGLRISEARQLRQEDVDLAHGIIRIMHSKGHKDRKVYLASDLTELLQIYTVSMEMIYDCKSEWFFPAREANKCLTNGTIDSQFRKSWAKTPYAAGCDRNPTVHCLRHSLE